jgi:hypothetical protein
MALKIYLRLLVGCGIITCRFPTVVVDKASAHAKMMKIVVIIVVIILVLILAILLGISVINKSFDKTFTADAVQVIAYNVAEELCEKYPITQSEIQDTIMYLYNGSVINIRIDNKGNPVDNFGNPFVVKYHKKDRVIYVTVTSSGPDRQLGTKDDIEFSHKEDLDSTSSSLQETGSGKKLPASEKK